MFTAQVLWFYYVMSFFFFPPTGLSHLFTAWNCWVLLCSYFGFTFIFLCEVQLNPCSQELVVPSSVFQDCHPIRSPSMSETFRCQMGKNTYKPCQSLDMQLTAATQKKSTIEPNLVCFFYHLQHQGRGDIAHSTCFLTGE